MDLGESGEYLIGGLSDLRLGSHQTWLMHHHQGVKRFCFKELKSAKDSAVHVAIEIDGMAYSDSSVVLVERKPGITVGNILDLDEKRGALQ